MLLMYGEVYQLQQFQFDHAVNVWWSVPIATLWLHIFHQGAVSECSDIVTENRSTISLPKKAQRRSIDIALLFR